jgi:carbon storage regulator
MLILMRRVGETLCIGEDIVVKVVSLDRNRVRLGVQAPPHVVVDRAEVAEKKRLGIAPPAKRTASSQS